MGINTFARRVLESMSCSKMDAENHFTGQFEQVCAHLAKVMAFDAPQSTINEWREELHHKFLRSAAAYLTNVRSKISESEIKRWCHQPIMMIPYDAGNFVQMSEYADLKRTGSVTVLEGAKVDEGALMKILLPVFMNAQKQIPTSEIILNASISCIAWGVQQRPRDLGSLSYSTKENAWVMKR